MAYIGVSPSNGVRKKHTYTATASQTSFSGAGDEGITLAYRDSNYVDVYQNGVKLADEDYTATSGTAIVLAQGASADDIVEIIAFDVFSVADTVSKADGGTFDGDVAMAGTLGVTGVLTGTSLDISGDIDVDGTTNLDVVDIDGAVDMASTLQVDGAITSSAGATITTADNTAQLTLVSTDADGSSGAILEIQRDSASPADGDAIGQIKFTADNDAGQSTLYGTINGTLRDASDGTEDGQMQFSTMVNGTTTDFIRYGVGGDGEVGLIFNEGSINADFRVESDDNANMLFVDGGNNIVGIGRVPATNDGGAGSLQLEGNDGMAFRRNGQTNSFILRPLSSGDGIRFTQAGGGGDRITIDSSGKLLVNTTSTLGSGQGVFTLKRSNK